MTYSDPDVIVIGAGLAGLCCGRRLAQCGVSFRILEAANGVGGGPLGPPGVGFTPPTSCAFPSICTSQFGSS